MQNMPDLQVPIALSCGFFGLFGLPVYPIGNELAVETTYPVGEATSSGILFMFGYSLIIRVHNTLLKFIGCNQNFLHF